MKRSLTEGIAAGILGWLAFKLYVPFVGIVFSYTIDIFHFLRYIPCNNPPCALRQMTYYAALVIHDTVLGLPIFFVFGSLFGMFIHKYHLSRPLILSLGFYCSQIYFLFVSTEFGFSLPWFIEIIRALPIMILFIVFTKVGHSIRIKQQALKGNEKAQPTRSLGRRGPCRP
jgi:glycosyltransferase involved in cell wall biosynthesis